LNYVIPFKGHLNPDPLTPLVNLTKCKCKKDYEVGFDIFGGVGRGRGRIEYAGTGRLWEN
jgi:hypothetical protein